MASPATSAVVDQLMREPLPGEEGKRYGGAETSPYANAAFAKEMEASQYRLIASQPGTDPEYAKTLMKIAEGLGNEAALERANRAEHERALQKQALEHGFKKSELPAETQIYNDLKAIYGPEQAVKGLEAFRSKSDIEKAKILAAANTADMKAKIHLYETQLQVSGRQKVAETQAEAKERSAAEIAIGQALARRLDLPPEAAKQILDTLLGGAQGGTGTQRATPGGVGNVPQPTGRLPLTQGPPARGRGSAAATPPPPTTASAVDILSQGERSPTPLPGPEPFESYRDAQGIYRQVEPTRGLAGRGAPRGYYPMDMWGLAMSRLPEALAQAGVTPRGVPPVPTAAGPMKFAAPQPGRFAPPRGMVQDPSELRAMSPVDLLALSGAQPQDPDEIAAIRNALLWGNYPTTMY